MHLIASLSTLSQRSLSMVWRGNLWLVRGKILPLRERNCGQLWVGLIEGGWAEKKIMGVGEITDERSQRCVSPSIRPGVGGMYEALRNKLTPKVPPHLLTWEGGVCNLVKMKIEIKEFVAIFFIFWRM